MTSAGASASDRTFQIRTVNSDNEVGGLVTEFTVDTTNAATIIDTDNLDGEYVVVYKGTVLNVDSSGVGTAASGSTEEAQVANASWEVAVQTLTTETDEDDTEVLQGDNAAIDVTSNRGSFQLDVTADGLDSEDLEEIFNQSSDNTFVSENVDDDEVTLQVTGDDTVVANFSEFDTVGDYTFDFQVNDTTASDSASVTVNELDTDINFGQSVTTEEVGDIAKITINMEDSTEAWVFIGGEDVNYLESVHVVDDDEDGEVVLEMNTFLAGQGSGPSTNAYDVAGDDKLGSDGVTRYDENNVTTNTDISPSLSEPLAAGDYDLRAASSNDIDADGDVEDEKGVGTLALRERSTDGIKTWVAPDGAANSDDLEDLLGEVSESDTVAKNDRLVVQVEASGLYGYVDDEDLSTLADNGLELKLEQTNEKANQNPVTLDADDLDSAGANAAQLYTDEDNNTFFVVIDTGAFSQMKDGQNYEASFSLAGENSDLADDLGNFNEYVEDEEEESVSTEFSVEDADAEFDNLQNGDLTVAKSSSSMVSGTTNVAPGTELTVRLRSSNSDSPFLKSQTVDVQADGTFSAEFDMSDVATGAEFTASIRKGGTVLGDEVDGVVGEGASAEVTFDDQETDGSSVVVSSVTLSEGGFVTIHDATLLDGDATGSVVGTSEYLDAGTHEDVEVSLDSTLEEDQELIAMPHMDSNGNEEYDFVTSEGADDGPYTGEDGNAVTDSAQITIGTGGTTTTGTATTTTSSGTTTTAATTSTTTDSTTSEPTTTEEEGPGFGALAAVIALIAAALLAVRRSN
ncbi:DUF7282 domain-containing protein [Haladaptatus sp. CMSO5]|uniref:DUF7282 domain-containing protein n=1 Tax=Haladaptatus sp. CMSO5 TaxID=3120514 RepID=UPI002FCE29DE